MMEKKEVEFTAWFAKNYRPCPKKDGWYSHRLYGGVSVTIEGARKVYDILINEGFILS